MTTEGNERLTTEFEQVNIKDLNEEELLIGVLEAGGEWTTQEKSLVVRAYGLAKYLHRHERYREDPFIYHSLRSAYRVIKFLHLSNPHLIAGVLLHDTVEHDPDEVIRYVAPGTVAPNYPLWKPDDPEEKQLLAFYAIEQQFSVDTARVVRGKTNPVTGIRKEDDREGWLREYHENKAVANRDPFVYFADLVDWIENGLNYVHSSEKLPRHLREGYNHKYGRSQLLLEDRFYQIDIQSLLDDTAKANILRAFEVGHERLHVPPRPRPIQSIGRLIVNDLESA